MVTSRLPDTLGSNVPEWPVFSTPRSAIMFLTQVTTSCEEGRGGLSRFITPYFKYSLIGLFKGVHPAEGMGV